MSPRYLLTPEALTDVAGIGAHIAQDSSVDAALRVHDALDEAFELLAKNPGIGHAREDLTDRPLKFWNVHSYLVVYAPSSIPLTIVAVIHGARDVKRLLKSV